MINFNVESIVDIRDDLFTLVREVWDEVDQRNNDEHLDPDWEIYEELERQGFVKFFTIRDPNLVGFCIVIMNPDLHLKGKIKATTDVLYVSSELRGTNVPRNFFTYIEKYLKNSGVSWFNIILKDYDRHDNFIESMNYKKQENIFQKRL